MAGDGWVLDIIWHALILVVNAVVDFLGNWSMEILLVFSFVMQLALSVFAGCRWRGASDAGLWFIWLFYVGGDYVATTALGKLSVGGASGERQLVAFWAPFFLLHLGGADSITAYELEDNQLSARAVLELVLRVVGTVYVVYQSISGPGSWALAPAVWLMLLVGVAKYVEKTLALHRANLANVRKSVELQQRRRRRARGDDDGHTTTSPGESSGGDHGEASRVETVGSSSDDELVMKAHSLFHICKQAIVDSSVEMKEPGETDTEEARIKDTLFKLNWKDMCKVMEMELSLMYDFLYTKAAVIHTWHGYCLRALSPLATAAALVLVEFSNRSSRHSRSDVVITRALLVATFLLETVSLLRALGSSWAGFFLSLSGRLGPGLRCSRHQALRTRCWHRLRRISGFRRRSYRSWSGKVGQLNMLKLVTGRDPSAADDEPWGSDDGSSQTIEIPRDVKKLVFDHVWQRLVKLRKELKDGINQARSGQAGEFVKTVGQLHTKRGEHALQDPKYGSLYASLTWSLGDELQVGILIWHIATEVYLSKSTPAEDRKIQEKESAIRMVSEYMMYLLVARPEMLPGLVTRKLFELTCDDLARFWSDDGQQTTTSSSSSGLCNSGAVLLRKLIRDYCPTTSRPRLNSKQIGKEGDLAKILYDRHTHTTHNDDALGTFISKGTELAKELMRNDRGSVSVSLIFEVWVEMLFYASYRCSRESHAKRLSHGGELATIVWLMAEHVGLFVISKTGKGAAPRQWVKDVPS